MPIISIYIGMLYIKGRANKKNEDGRNAFLLSEAK